MVDDRIAGVQGLDPQLPVNRTLLSCWLRGYSLGSGETSISSLRSHSLLCPVSFKVFPFLPSLTLVWTATLPFGWPHLMIFARVHGKRMKQQTALHLPWRLALLKITQNWRQWASNSWTISSPSATACAFSSLGHILSDFGVCAWAPNGDPTVLIWFIQIIDSYTYEYLQTYQIAPILLNLGLTHNVVRTEMVCWFITVTCHPKSDLRHRRILMRPL